jgi:GH24 family phage-related lysozyme (muramidase)
LANIAAKFEEVDNALVSSFVAIPEPPPPIIFTIYKIPQNLLKETSDCGVSAIAFSEDCLFYEKDYFDKYDSDGACNCTGGIGHKIHDGACDGRAEESKYNHMTKKQAIAQLKIDIAIAEAYVKKWVTYPLTQAQFDALVSMAFNMGHIPLDILHFVNIGDIKEAAKLFLDYDEANDGSHPQGLHDRRIRERDLFLDGWYGNEACDPVKRMPPGMR